jgi:Uncharacterized protein conserved in bacteria
MADEGTPRPNIAEDEARVASTGAAYRARSRRVMQARKWLPMLLLALVLGVVGWIVARSFISGAERKSGQNQEISLENAMFHGQDALGRSFSIGAKGAIRDPQTGLFRLVGPTLTLNLGGRRTTELSADGGSYDPANNRVIIGPNVRIADGESGMTLETPEAVVDTQTGIITGDKGIRGAGPLGTIDASSYVIGQQGRQITFSGAGDNKVRGTYNLARSDG